MKELTIQVVRDFVSLTDGNPFTTRDAWAELDILSAGGKSKLREYLHRLKKDGIINADGRGGRFRLVDADAPEVDWQHAAESFIDVKFPFELEKYIRMKRRTYMVVAGDTSAGKTAFAYGTVCKNMYALKVLLLTTLEGGEGELKERIEAIDGNIPNPPPFITKYREDNFADVIDPDAVNIIDSLDLDSEVYMVGAELKRIQRKLRLGCAIVMMQKPEGRDLAYGGGFSIKNAYVYIVLEKNLLKIKKAKARTNRKINPVNKQWTFKLDDTGGNFIIQDDWGI